MVSVVAHQPDGLGLIVRWGDGRLGLPTPVDRITHGAERASPSNLPSAGWAGQSRRQTSRHGTTVLGSRWYAAQTR